MLSLRAAGSSRRFVREADAVRGLNAEEIKRRRREVDCDTA